MTKFLLPLLLVAAATPAVAQDAPARPLAFERDERPLRRDGPHRRRDHDH